MTANATDTFPVLSDDRIRRYLEHLRIDLSAHECVETTGLPVPSLNLLSEIQSQHYYRKPFESLSIHLPRDLSTVKDNDAIPYQQALGSLSLDPDRLFSKIIDNGRAGFCFELNGFLNLVLRSLGYQVTTVLARVFGHLNEDPQEVGYQWITPTHQCSIVHFSDGGQNLRYHVDVAFGAGQPETPILLDQKGTPEGPFYIEHGQLPGSSFIHTLPMGYTLSRRNKAGKLSPLYHVIDHSVLPQDLHLYNFYSSTYPDAVFVKSLICTLGTPTGRETITHTGETEGALWTSTINGTKTKRRLTTFGEFKQVLASTFNIEL